MEFGGIQIYYGSYQRAAELVGKKEAAEKTVSLRRLGSQEKVSMPLDQALKLLADEATPPDLKRAAG